MTIKKAVILLFSIFLLGVFPKGIFAQDSQSVLYVPLIGITSVPTPLALPDGPGTVTFNYAIKNFIREAPLSNIQVVDNQCSSIKYITGDDNRDSLLDYQETWRYSCTVKLTETTQSIASVTGTANNITASHKAYITVVVGSETPHPIVSIINITKVANPLSLPTQGGQITFTYKVNNPGSVPLSDVTVVDNKCPAMSGKLGDTNGNNLLDLHEVWIYTCTANLTQTTTNTVRVTAYANGLKAIDDASLTVNVKTPTSPRLPQTGSSLNLKVTLWKILSVVLIILIFIFWLTKKIKRKSKKLSFYRKK